MVSSSRHPRPPAFAAVALLCLLILAPSAMAETAGPATVTVRVEGLTQTLLPTTEVTTTTAPVIKDGMHACPGTSAAGALQLASAGNWNGAWFSGLGYSVETLEGQSLPFTQPYYWSFWLDNKPASSGICLAELHPGDSVLFFPECFSETVGVCPAHAPNPLGIRAPASAEVGTPVTVTVTSYANATGAPSPAPGATVTAAGQSATTDPNGQASFTFSGAGNVSIGVSAPESVRSETSVCVHAGDDGTCGAIAPAIAATPAGGPPPQGKALAGPAIVADLTGLIDSHRYARADAPRVLAGKVTAKAVVTSIALRLRRTYRGRCWAYDGKRERFLRVRCRRGGYFRIASSGGSFSYLLPSRLPPGRYVLDISALDAAGDHTKLVRGTSRIVFYVA